MDPGAKPFAEDLREFLAHRDRFLAFLRRHVGSDADAEDLLQQSLFHALRRQFGWDGKENALAWFYRVLRNAIIDHYRSRASDSRKAESLGREPDPALTATERERLCACFEELLTALKPEYADALRRLDLKDEDPGEVAAAVGITVNNLTVRLHRARQALRKSLERTCGACTRHGCLDCSCIQAGGPVRGSSRP